MDRQTRRLEILQYDSDLAAANFVVIEQPDRDDANAEPAQHAFAHSLGIVDLIPALHRDHDLPVGTGEMPFVAGGEPGVDDAVMG